MSGIIVDVVVGLFERLYKWTQTPKGQTVMKRLFKAIRKAWEKSLIEEEGKA